MDNSLFFKENLNIPIIKIQISNKQIIMEKYLTIDIIKKYLEQCETNENYRKEFCKSIYYNIKNIEYKYGKQNISISEIYNMKDKELIDILYTFLNDDKELKKYFDEEFNGNYFKGIYLATKKQFEELNKLTDRYVYKFILSRKKIHHQIRDVHDELLKFGWYFYSLDNQCKYLNETEKSIERLLFVIKDDKKSIGDIKNRIDNYMNNLVRNDCENVIKYIISKFPKRSHIIKDCYKAHQNKLYTLSIPVFLAQIDGIAVQIINGDPYNDSLFTKKRQMIFDELKKKIKEDTFNYMLYVYPLELIAKECCPIGIRSKDRNTKIQNHEIYSHFNRNGVLHGVDIDYNNETNSNKCIAILGHLARLKEIYDSYFCD